jgi:hypothetical protein
MLIGQLDRGVLIVEKQGLRLSNERLELLWTPLDNWTPDDG